MPEAFIAYFTPALCCLTVAYGALLVRREHPCGAVHGGKLFLLFGVIALAATGIGTGIALHAQPSLFGFSLLEQASFLSQLGLYAASACVAATLAFKRNPTSRYIPAVLAWWVLVVDMLFFAWFLSIAERPFTDDVWILIVICGPGMVFAACVTAFSGREQARKLGKPRMGLGSLFLMSVTLVAADVAMVSLSDSVCLTDRGATLYLLASPVAVLGIGFGLTLKNDGMHVATTRIMPSFFLFLCWIRLTWFTPPALVGLLAGWS